MAKRGSLKVTACGNVVFGSTLDDFPTHLQRAWGRNVARMMYADGSCKLWLRDLPLSVYDLCYAGFEYVLPAFRSEEARLTDERL